MAVDKTIEELTGIPSALVSTDLIAAERPGAIETYKATFAQVLSFISTSLTIGTFTFGTAAPSGGNDGDVYLKTDTGQLYKKVSGSWVLQITLATSAADGTLLYGTALPSSGDGIDGDSYIRTTTGVFYKKASGSWTSQFSMATGPAGANGKAVLNGTGVPSSGLGTDGDFYIRTDNNTIYGPKAAGAWGSATSMIGPTGATGATGGAGSGYYATSTSSVAIGTGSKTFTTQSGLAYVIGERVRVVYDTSNYIEGIITSYISTSLVVLSDRVVGSGTYANWVIGVAGEVGATGATGATGAAGGAVTATELIVAYAGGGQASATVISATKNLVETVASNGDSVKLDTAVVGNVREIVNLSANDMDIFPASGEEIKYGTTGLGLDTAYSLPAGNSITLVCYLTGVYRFY